MGLPPVDYQVHNSLFLVAHFHTMIVGGALFGIIAGITYWFPKITGFKLNEKLGKMAFWTWLAGFYLSFVPLYILGIMGATRRLDNYDPSTGWQSLFIVSLIGVCVIVLGVTIQVIQIIVSIKQRNQNRDLTGDPWNGRSLEWATSSPPPFYNFALIPHVEGRDAFWEMKKHGITKPSEYEDIELPKNTPLGIYLSGFAFLFGLAAVWRSPLFIIVSVLGIIWVILKRSFDPHTEYTLAAAEVKRLEEQQWKRQ